MEARRGLTVDEWVLSVVHLRVFLTVFFLAPVAAFWTWAAVDGQTWATVDGGNSLPYWFITVFVLGCYGRQMWVTWWRSFAFDIADGRLRWRTGTQVYVHPVDRIRSCEWLSGPERLRVVGANGGIVCALHPGGGSPVWGEPGLGRIAATLRSRMATSFPHGQLPTEHPSMSARVSRGVKKTLLVLVLTCLVTFCALTVGEGGLYLFFLLLPLGALLMAPLPRVSYGEDGISFQVFWHPRVYRYDELHVVAVTPRIVEVSTNDAQRLGLATGNMSPWQLAAFLDARSGRRR